MIQHQLTDSADASVEDTITAVWADVLQTTVPGPDASFFALGGTSLQAARMIGRLRDALDVRIPLNLLFETHTVAGLAREIQRLRGAVTNGGVTIQPYEHRADGDFQAPTSFAQRRLWVEQQILGHTATYNVPSAVEIQGPLDVDALRRAWRDLIDRHEIFRTTFRAVGGVPVQVVAAQVDLPFTITSLLDKPVDDRAHAVVEHLFAAARRPFDLERGPLVRVELIQVEDDWNVLFINMHHVITDGVSYEIAIAELLEDYTAHVKGEQPTSRATTLQYADFAAWQQRTISAAEFDEQLAYWKSRLCEPRSALDLPTDEVTAAEPAGLGANVSIELRRVLARRITELSMRHDATPFMTVLTALNVLLHRYSGQTDLMVGVPSSGRQLPELEDMLGFFVNTLVLRCDLSADPPADRLLAHVREVALGAYANQDVPFERVVNAVSGNRSARQNLFRVMLTSRRALPAPSLPGLTVTPVDLDTDTVKFDLVFAITEADSTFRLSLVYNADLFTEQTAQRMLEHLRGLLDAMVTNPTARISELPMPTEDEQRQIAEWSVARTEPYPVDVCLHEMVERQAVRTPDGVAVEFGSQRLTYAELEHRAHRLASRLRDRGVSTDQIVGLCVEPSIELVIGVLGILKAGAAYVPIGPLVPSERAAFMLADSAARVMVSTSRVYDRLGPRVHGDVEVLHIDDDDTGDYSTVDIDSAGFPAVRPDQLAYLLYTSGTTGRPKAVEVMHGNAVPFIRWGNEAMPVGPGDRVLQNASYQFDWSVEEIFHTLTSGACLVVLPPRVRADPAATVEFVNANGITAVYLTPTQARGVVATGVEMPGLRYLAFAGEKLDRDLVERTRSLVSRDCVFWNEYGPTETTIVAVAGVVDGSDAGQGQPPLGRLVANATCVVVDQYNKPQPIGVPGELCLGGDGVARGYRNQPALTAERFVPDPANPGKRLYRTGDVVRWLPDGRLEFLGRTDHQVKIRGVRIEPAEIEAVLRGHADISDVVVLPDQAGRLIAYVVTESGTAVDDAELREFMAPKLPNVMRPSTFVALAALPTTTSGKIDRGKLAADSVPDAGAPVRADQVPPRTELEKTIAVVWSEVLEQDVVDAHANFFELGGDSLKYLTMIEQLRERLGLEIPIRAVVDAGTVATLSEQVEVLRWTVRTQGAELELAGDREVGEL